MPLQKQNLQLNFAQGLDTKTDPKQVSPGRFLVLENSIFDKSGLLQKRFGYDELPSLPNTNSRYVTTFNGNLTAFGTNVNAFSAGSNSWVNRGFIRPLALDTLSLIRSNLNQTECDAAISSNGLVCTVFIETGGTVTPNYRFAIADVTTGQNVVAPTTLASATGSPKVFVLGNYFVVTYPASSASLRYVAINIYTLASTAATDIVTNHTNVSSCAYDGVVANNSLYIAYNGSDGGGAIRMTYLDQNLNRQTSGTGTNVANGKSATIMSVVADTSNSTPIIYASFYTTTGTAGYVLAVSQTLVSVLAATAIIVAGTVPNITAYASSGSINIYYEVTTAYTYDSAVATNLIKTVNVTQAGSVGSTTTLMRSVGLASKAFSVNSTTYFLGAYSSSYQPSYFLIDSTGKVVSKLAYENGGGYLTKGLPSVSVDDTTASVAYLFKDLIEPVNKTQGSTVSAAVYSQTGINLARFTLEATSIVSSEIANNLHLSGGFLWMYDGYVAVEHGFHLYPDNVEVTTSGAGGSITAQQYFYVALYEWTDNQGNIFRSAPSVPVSVTTTGATSTNTINVPTLRLTLKTDNIVKIVVYRWSAAQQTYYQVTSVSSPTLNSLTVDSVAITDTLADSSIVGNSIVYTNGGVVENIGAPATLATTLFRSRLFLIDAEDQNLLWYSKQVIESTPVEMSDLFTLFVSPTIGSQGDTGKMKCLSAMDDKLIIFKKNAIYYMVGQGPDNTGANNDFSEPVFITSTVGCENQNSIVFIPNGLMFQSDKGIWLLGRDLSTSYIGSPVDDFKEDTVLSAVAIPGTNQVRFTLDSGITLMYDYFYNQWGSFTGIAAISSTLYGDAHTYINSDGEVFQEGSGYLDGSHPVNMQFTTGWFNLSGLQGFERAYMFYLIGKYISPHKLHIQIAYDYADAPTQSVLISPDNYNGPIGSGAFWGSGTPLGGTTNLEQWQVFFNIQKCQAFQITVSEMFDASIGVAAGAGLTLSGIDLVIGTKKGYPKLAAAHSVG